MIQTELRGSNCQYYMRCTISINNMVEPYDKATSMSLLNCGAIYIEKRMFKVRNIAVSFRPSRQLLPCDFFSYFMNLFNFWIPVYYCCLFFFITFIYWNKLIIYTRNPFCINADARLVYKRHILSFFCIIHLKSISVSRIYMLTFHFSYIQLYSSNLLNFPLVLDKNEYIYIIVYILLLKNLIENIYFHWYHWIEHGTTT